MKQIETLQLIRVRCVELLEQAKLRTPGAWEAGTHTVWSGDRMVADADDDSSFIASAAGNFEAALESTIAAVDGLLATCDGFRFPDEDRPAAWKAINRIIAAWKHLLP